MCQYEIKMELRLSADAVGILGRKSPAEVVKMAFRGVK